MESKKKKLVAIILASILLLLAIGVTGIIIATTRMNKGDDVIQTPIVQTLHFNIEGVEELEDIKATPGETIELPTPAREGYTFVEWRDAEEGGNVIEYITMPTFESGITEMELYGVWSANEYTIAYNNNTGSGEIANQIATYDQNITLSNGTGFTKEGYTLTNWNTQANGEGTDYALGYTFNPYTLTNDLTLYAQWTINSYTIGFEEHGGTAVADITNTNYGTSITLPTPTRTGYAFDGWYDQAEGGNQITWETMPDLSNGGVTLHAHWTANEYTIAYNNNTGSGEIANQTATYNQNITLDNGTNYTKTGYTLTKWNTQADGNGTNYALGYTFSPYTLTNGLTLYAVWQANQYTVTYNKNGGSGTISNQTATYNQNITLNNGTNYTKTGYTLTKWNTQADGNGTDYTLGYTFNPYTLTNGLTLYAQWTIESYNITFVTDGSAVANITNTNYGTSITLPETTKDHYVFNGWYDAQTGGTHITWTTMPDLGDTGATKTLYAQWTIESYNITFVTDGSAVSNITNTNYGTSITLPETTKDHYVFNGWYDEAEGGNHIEWTNMPDLGANNATKTLYAQWTIESYNITFEENGGTEVANITNTNYGASITLPETTKEHYVFNGWYDQAEGGNHIEWTTMPDLGNTGATKTLYAQWSIEQYTITYRDENNEDYSGSNLSSLPTTHTYGTATALVNGVKDEYLFIGWYLEPDCSGTAVTTLGATEYTSAITLYAKWEAEIFTVSGNSITGLTAYGQTLSEITIPSQINGTIITRIYNNAFKYNTTITSVTLPSSVTSIGSNAFYQCSNVTSISMPNVTGIGYQAFYGCSALTNISMPNVTSIGQYAFSNCSNLTSITMQNVTSIDYSAFESCSNLKRVYYKSDIASWCNITFSIYYSNPLMYGADLYVWDNTNEEYVKVEELEIPSSVTQIKNYAFNGCTSITSVILPSSVTSTGHDAFQYCSNLTSVEIPSSVTSIGSGAFRYCSALASIDIPNVTSIGNQAFSNCSALTSISMPEVTSIGQYAFQYCGNLTSISILNVTSIDSGTFRYCSALATIDMPNVTSIGQYAFSSCSALTSISMPNVTSIGSSAFSDCKNFIVYYGGTSSQWSSLSNRPTTDVYVAYYSESEPESNKTTYWHYVDNVATLWEEPDIYSITSAGALSLTLYGKTQLTGEVIIPSELNGIAVTSIANNGFQYCHASSIILPNSVTSIGQYAFYGCRATSITMPKVTNIGNYAFQSCSALTSITMPKVTSVGQSAFQSCSALTSIEIPSSVTSIGWDAFRYSSNLKSVYITDIASWCNITFSSEFATPLRYGADLYIWDNTNEEYVKLEDELEIPSSVTQIKAYAFYNCSNLKRVYYKSDIASWCNITFDGSYTNPLCYGADLYVWDNTNEEYVKVESLEIPSSVTQIKQYAFSGCKSITSVILPSSVTSIGDYAFNGCSALTSITMPYVTSIGQWAFNYCIALTSISMPNVTSIGSNAFRYCSALTSIEIPSSVTSIGNSAFISCSALASIVMPNVTSIGQGAFWDCSALASITMPNVTSIGSSAFQSCSALTSITMPNVTSIGNSAFLYCSNLTSVEMPNVTSISSYAFESCSALTSILMPNVTSIGKYAFSNCGGCIVYYGGTSSQWSSLSNRPTDAVYVAYYSESEPESDKTSYWHYVDNVATLWEEPDIYSITSAGELSLTDYAKTQLAGEVTIPSEVTSITVTSIGVRGFEYSHATSVILPNTVTSIGQSVFYNCSALASITMPNVTSIGSGAFSYCSALTSVTMPNVTSIGSSAFYYCSNLTSVTMSSVTSVGSSAFNGCGNLKRVYYKSDIASWCNITFSNYYSNPLYYGADLYVWDNTNEEYVKVEALEIPSGVTQIKDYAFQGCTSITSVTLPSSVTSIGGAAFSDCGALKTVTIETSNISNGLTSQTAQGYLVNYATTIYIKEGLTTSSSTYLNNNFHTVTSDKAGYVKYVKNS